MEISVLCPVVKVRINAGSKIVDDFKIFSAYVLQALNDGYTIREIEAVIGLGETVVIEEVDYLKKIGFLVGEANELSKSGRDFCALISLLETINERELYAFIELYSGKIFPYETDLLEQPSQNRRNDLLKKLVSHNALYDRNYLGVKEFLWKQFSSLLDGIENKQQESIYTQLVFNKHEEMYVRLSLDITPEHIFTKPCPDTLNLRFRHSFLHIKWTVETQLLVKYKDYIGDLKKLSTLDEGILLSSVGHELLAQRNNIQTYHHELKPLVYDNFFREFVECAPYIDDDTFDIELPQQIEVSIENWQEACKGYFAHYITQSILPNIDIGSPLIIADLTVSNSYYVQHIPFNCFLTPLFERVEGEVDDAHRWGV